MGELIAANRTDFAVDATPTSGSLQTEQVKQKLEEGRIWIGMDFQIEALMEKIPNMYMLEGEISLASFYPFIIQLCLSLLYLYVFTLTSNLL